MSINSHMAIVGVSLLCTVSQAGPPPSLPIRSCGLLHEPLGAAVVLEYDTDGDGNSDRVTVGNIGSSGNDGAKITLSNMPNSGTASPALMTSGWSGDIDFGHAGDLPTGMNLTITARNWEGNLIPWFEVNETNNGDAAVTLAEPCVNCTVSFEAYLNGVRVADLDGDGLSDIVVTGAIGSVAPAPVTGGGTPIELPITLTKSMRKRHNGHVTILKLAGPTNVTPGGGGLPGASIECDTIVIDVSHEAQIDAIVLDLEVTAANVAPGQVIELTGESVLARQFELTALGGTHLTGIEACPAACDGVIEVANIGSSGQDGVSIIESPYMREGGHTVGAGQVIEIVNKTLDPGDELNHCIEGRLIDGAAPVLVCSTATGGQGGSLNIEISDSSTGSDQWVAQVYRLNIPVVPAGQPTSGPPIALVSGFPPGTPPAITGFGMSRHMGGEHMMGAMWKFASDCRITLAGGILVMGDELRIIRTTALPLKKEEGGRHTPFQNKAAIAGAKVEITEIQPAQMGFSSGYAFGLQHQAIGGAQLYVRDFSSIDNAPEEKERGITVSSARAGGGGGCGSGGECGVQIVIGQAEGIRLELEDLQLDGIAPECVGTVKSAVPGNRDVYVWKVKKGPSSNVELNTDFSAAGSTQQTISLFLNGGLVVSLPAQPNNTAMLTTGQPKIVENKKGLAISLGGNEDDGEIKFYWNQPTEVEVGGQLYSADVIVCRAEAPKNTDSLAFITLTMNGELSEITLTDEAVQQFNGNHTGSGAAQLLVAADINQDGRPDLVLTNPSDGGLATMASQRVRSVVAAVERYHTEHDWDMIIPDPCAGLPPDCIPWPNEARYYWSQEVYGDDPFTTEHEAPVPFTVSCTFIENTAGGGHVEMEIDPSALGATTYHLQMYLNGNLVEDVPDYSGPLHISGDGGNNLNWPFGLNTALGDVVLSFTTSFTNGRYVLRSGVPLLTGKPVLCDELRFIVTPANLMLTGLRESTLTTTDIETVYITGIQYDPEPVCRADIAPPPGGDNTVGVPDLLAVINSWGPCPAPCTADLAPGNGDGTVGVPDLLFIINNWGPCP